MTFSKTCPRPVSLKVDPVFVQTHFYLFALRTYPVRLCFLHCVLNTLVCFLEIFCSVCFIPPFLQIPRFITEIENISGDPRLFPAMFIPSSLTGCITHYCIVGGNHGIDVHVFIAGGGCSDIFLSSILSFFFLSLGPIKTEILSRRGVKPKPTNQPCSHSSDQ